jgi:acyl carrier protein
VENTTSALGDRIVTVVQRLIGDRPLPRPVSSDDSLVEVGLTSLDAVRLVLLVEDEFDLTIPLGKITPANFRSVSTISRLVNELLTASDQLL